MPTLYRNGRVRTPSGRLASAFAVDAGQITWIGDADALGSVAAARIVDLDGGYVTPAFVDAHVHSTASGLLLTGLDLTDVRSATELLDRVARQTRVLRGRPIIGLGWDESGWDDSRLPTAQELDRAAYGGVVYLSRIDGHSALVSSALAQRAGLNGGWIREPEYDLLTPAVQDSLAASDVRAAQLAYFAHAAGLGIGCVHEMAGPIISSAADLAAALELSRAEAVPEVIGYWGELMDVATATDVGAVGVAGDLFCDGSLGSRTAAVSEPYLDEPGSTGFLRYSTEEITEHFLAAEAAGLQAGFHAIGDAAVDRLLDALDVVTARLGRPGGAGHRVEHVELVNDPGRLAATGLVASMQPLFDPMWGGSDGMYATRLGVARSLASNRLADHRAAGTPLAFGSDSPVTPTGPWEAVRAATAHHDPAASIDPVSAFDAHTQGGWLAARRAGEGRLAPGLPATFAVWEVGGLDTGTGLPPLGGDDPLPICRQTVRAGVVIHDADDRWREALRS